MQPLLGTLPSDYNRIIHYLFIIFISFIFYNFAVPIIFFLLFLAPFLGLPERPY